MDQGVKFFFLALALTWAVSARAADSTSFSVTVPDAGTSISFDGEPTTQVGTQRLFTVDSSDLNPERRYSYDVRAALEVDGVRYDKTISVGFHSGDQVSLRFYWRRQSASRWVLDATFSIAGASYGEVSANPGLAPPPRR